MILPVRAWLIVPVVVTCAPSISRADVTMARGSASPIEAAVGPEEPVAVLQLQLNSETEAEVSQLRLVFTTDDGEPLVLGAANVLLYDDADADGAIAESATPLAEVDLGADGVALLRLGVVLAPAVERDLLVAVALPVDPDVAHGAAGMGVVLLIMTALCLGWRRAVAPSVLLVACWAACTYGPPDLVVDRAFVSVLDNDDIQVRAPDTTPLPVRGAPVRSQPFAVLEVRP